MQRFIPPTAQDEIDSKIGGKAKQLLALELIPNIKVPEWFVLTTEILDQVLIESGGVDIVNGIETAENYSEIAKSLQELIIKHDLSQILKSQILEATTNKFTPIDFVAVRSSAIGEDSANESFAGVHESYLFLQGEDEIILGIKKVWASAFSERAFEYRKALGIPLTSIKIAVIVQKMVEAETSGVVFTANPITNDVEEIVINSLYGLGEGLVSEGLDADSWIFDKETFEITATIVEKEEEIVFNSSLGLGTHRIDISDERGKQASLSEVQIKELAATALSIEKYCKCPQDIEFAYSENKQLFILQTRSITTIDSYGPAVGHKLLWDNSNIIESYSGVTSPLTFSFIKRAYTIVYHCFAEVMGISPKVVKANEQTFSNMLGLFHGQVYYNLLNWYRLIQLFPGFSYTSKYMESMMGVSESLKNELSPPPGVSNSKIRGLFDLAKLLVSSSLKFFRIRSITSEFQNHFKINYLKWSKLDFKKHSSPELMKIYYEMEEKLLWNWKAPIINDFYVMVFYGLLKKLCSSWCSDEQGTLQNDLLSGEGGIESTEPTKMLIRLASITRNDAELSRLVAEEPATNLKKIISGNEDFIEFKNLFDEYLERYGFRCMNELKLEEFSLRDKPEIVFEHLKNYLNVPKESLDLHSMEEREQALRKSAETKVSKLLAEKTFSIVRTKIFDLVLTGARLGVKNRENMRFARTKIYGLLRELFRAVGHQFKNEGLINNEQDIFFLSVEEIWDFVRGTAITTNLSGLVELRKSEFKNYRSDEENMPDSRFSTYGVAYNRNKYRSRPKTTIESVDGELSGIGCCPGIISGVVKVIKDPTEGISLNREILVAGRTDPGWVPLYPAAIGILIERGSILSHSAIVAREMGIPTIVGIPGLLKTLKTGDEVEMNGATGKIINLTAKKV